MFAAGWSTTGAPTSRWCSASPRRWRCSLARCWSATRCAAACAISCSQRIGRTDRAIVSTGFFREALGDDLARDGALAGAAPLVAVEGTVSDQASGRRASRVQVYGVDDRFWRFHGVAGVSGPSGRDALLSQALASDIGAAVDNAVLVRIERPSAIPIESLHGRKDDAGRTLRLDVRAVLSAADLGEFSLRPQQGAVRAVFVPLARLQQDLELRGRVNTLLIANGASADNAALERLVRARFALEDVGLTTRVVGDAVAVESAAGLLDAPRAMAVDAAAQNSGVRPQPVLTYLANTMRSGDRQIPYSLVTAIDLRAIGVAVDATAANRPIVLNDWAARDLAVKPGDPLSLEYFVWEDPGRLVTRSADFTVAAVVPIAGPAADRDLDAGLSRHQRSGDPRRLGSAVSGRPQARAADRRGLLGAVPDDAEGVRAVRGRAGAVGFAIWRSHIGPPAAGRRRIRSRRRRTCQDAAPRRDRSDGDGPHRCVDVRGGGLAASRGATDFGEYFTYFSFFLVASALLLAVLFFRLAVEQRAREVGLLRAVGFSTPRVRQAVRGRGFRARARRQRHRRRRRRRLCRRDDVRAPDLVDWRGRDDVADAARLAAVARRGRRRRACRGDDLHLVDAARLARLSERSLLAGEVGSDGAGVGAGKTGGGRAWWAAIAFAIAGIAMVTASAGGAIDQTGGFFGAGSSLLVACLCLAAAILRRPPRSLIHGRGWPAVARLGLRNAAHRPGRSVLAIGVIASATFILIAVDAFHKEAPSTTDRQSGVGGYALLVDMLMPIAHDPNSPEGRDAIGLADIPPDDITIEPFRVRPGDDASCLNLYEPRESAHPRRPPVVHRRRALRVSELARSRPTRSAPTRGCC